MKTKLSKPTILLLAVALFGGCALIQPTVSSDSARLAMPSPSPVKSPKSIGDVNFEKEAKSKYDATLADLERNRQLWQESKIENYDFEISYVGGAMSGWAPVAIKVREGKKIAPEEIPKDSLVDKSQLEKLETIEKMFDFMEQELDNGRIINAKYNKELGYPEEIGIGYAFKVDAFKLFYIKKFEIVK